MKKYLVRVNGVPFEVELDLIEDDEEELPAGLPRSVAAAPRLPVASSAAAPLPRPSAPTPASATPGQILSPLTGTVNKVQVKPGQGIKRGDVLVEIEAMKMNTKVYAPDTLTVEQIHVKEGENVQQGQLLVSVKAS
ncbi:biotin/lipoyl-binding protein [bacterium]|nr:biotin/lipoyl-binding protein [bacterium]